MLADAALAIPGLRPALFPPDVLPDWDAALRFRHFLRHAYVVTLDPERLRANVARLAQAATATEPWLEAVLQALLAT